MKIVKNALAPVALAALLISQPAAAAPAQMERASAISGEADELRRRATPVIVIIAAFGGLLLLAELLDLIQVFGDDDPVSP